MNAFQKLSWNLKLLFCCLLGVAVSCLVYALMPLYELSVATKLCGMTQNHYQTYLYAKISKVKILQRFVMNCLRTLMKLIESLTSALIFPVGIKNALKQSAQLNLKICLYWMHKNLKLKTGKCWSSCKVKLFLNSLSTSLVFIIDFTLLFLLH